MATVQEIIEAKWPGSLDSGDIQLAQDETGTLSITYWNEVDPEPSIEDIIALEASLTNELADIQALKNRHDAYPSMEALMNMLANAADFAAFKTNITDIHTTYPLS